MKWHHTRLRAKVDNRLEVKSIFFKATFTKGRLYLKELSGAIPGCAKKMTIDRKQELSSHANLGKEREKGTKYN